MNLRHGAYETPALPLSYTAESRKSNYLGKRVYLRRHRYARRYARELASNVLQIGRRAPEVVAQAPGDASLLARRHPSLPEVADLLTAVPAGEMRKEMRDDPPEQPLESLHAFELGRQ